MLTTSDESSSQAIKERFHFYAMELHLNVPMIFFFLKIMVKFPRLHTSGAQMRPDLDSFVFKANETCKVPYFSHLTIVHKL